MIIITDDTFDSNVNVSGIVVVYFGATWCGPCRIYSPIFESVSSKLPDVGMFKADIDQCPQVAAKLSITAVPTTIIFSGGSKVHVMTGVKQEQDLLEAIKLQME